MLGQARCGIRLPVPDAWQPRAIPNAAEALHNVPGESHHETVKGAALRVEPRHRGVRSHRGIWPAHSHIGEQERGRGSLDEVFQSANERPDLGRTIVHVHQKRDPRSSAVGRSEEQESAV